MKKILYFDTETTGFPKSSTAPLEEQPHVVQLACTLVCAATRKEMVSLSVIVDCPIEEIPSGASDIHGITHDVMRAFGISPRAALSAFHQFTKQADVIVAHNIAFDLKLLDYLYQRENVQNPLWTMEQFCTMQATTNLCKLPAANGRGGYKWPKLTEAYMHFFGETLDGAHDALVDVRGCQRVHLHLLGDVKAVEVKEEDVV
jgi:DNA polymerase-3 subunit epsilon